MHEVREPIPIRLHRIHWGVVLRLRAIVSRGLSLPSTLRLDLGLFSVGGSIFGRMPHPGRNRV
jgi:hypothetical protein